MIADFILGLDLGQASDYTALAVLQWQLVPVEPPPADPPQLWRSRLLPKTASLYHVRHLERFQLGTPYPAIVGRVGELVGTEALRGQTMLAVDETGVGAPVVDLLRAAKLPGELHPITITAGHDVHRDLAGYHVPKRDLVSTMQVLLQGGRLKVAERLPLAELLVKELLAFRVKVTAAANETFEAWRERDHDDLVLAVALACWLGEMLTPAPVSPPTASVPPFGLGYSGAARRFGDIAAK